MLFDFRRLNLQLFAEGGDGGTGDAGAADSGVSSPDAGEARLRELGVPEDKLRKRAQRASKFMPQAKAAETPKPIQQVAAADDTTTPVETKKDDTAPARMSWEEIMADPEYNKQMQETVKNRLKKANEAEDKLSKLAPALEMLADKYGLDASELDYEALSKAISDDDAYYEEKAIEMGVPIETAKKLEQYERQSAREAAEREQSIKEQKIQGHFVKLQQQAAELKKTFTSFDLMTELQNPVFARMTSPDSGLSLEDAYYAIHRKEIMAAGMQATAQKTAEQVSKSIQAGRARPIENGTSNQSPSVSNFDYAHASREQRDALKRQIREAAAQGRKIYPGQYKPT